MRHACVPAQPSIYQGVYKLPPREILTVEQNGQPSFLLLEPATQAREPNTGFVLMPMSGYAREIGALMVQHQLPRKT